MLIDRIPEERIILVRRVDAGATHVRKLYIENAQTHGMALEEMSDHLVLRSGFNAEAQRGPWVEVEFSEDAGGTMVRAVARRPPSGVSKTWTGLLFSMMAAATMISVDASPFWALALAGLFFAGAQVVNGAEQRMFDRLNTFVRTTANRGAKMPVLARTTADEPSVEAKRTVARQRARRVAG